MRGKIDKSVLTFGTRPLVRDRGWLDAHEHMTCACCDARDGTVIPAHIRTGLEGGTGLKPSDDLVVPLCVRCNADQEANPGPDWWFEMLLKTWARRRYQLWKSNTAQARRLVELGW